MTNNLTEEERLAKLEACRAHMADLERQIETLKESLLVAQDAEAQLAVADPFWRSELARVGLVASVYGYPGSWMGSVALSEEKWFVAHHLYVRKAIPEAT
jgi:hypothetical protein